MGPTTTNLLLQYSKLTTSLDLCEPVLSAARAQAPHHCTWPMHCQTCGYLPSRRALSLIDRYYDAWWQSNKGMNSVWSRYCSHALTGSRTHDLLIASLLSNRRPLCHHVTAMGTAIKLLRASGAVLRGMRAGEATAPQSVHLDKWDEKLVIVC